MKMHYMYMDFSYGIDEIESALTPPLVKLLKSLWTCDCDMFLCGKEKRMDLVEVTIYISEQMAKGGMRTFEKFLLLDIGATDLVEEGSMKVVCRKKNKALHISLQNYLHKKRPEIIPESGIYLFILDHTDVPWPIARVGSATEVFRALAHIKQRQYERRLGEWRKYEKEQLKIMAALQQISPRKQKNTQP